MAVHMDSLAKIIGAATLQSTVQYRKHPYGKKGIREFLRDVMAMANAAVKGKRYIVIGAEIDRNGRPRFRSVNPEDFALRPDYQVIASEFIEPPIRIHYRSQTIDEKRIGIFEIGGCQDRPYMMRIDHSELLRRGDAYMRINDTAVKMGRRQLQLLFEKKFQDSVSSACIEIGFAGEIIYKDRILPTCDLSMLPSEVAGSKLKQMIEIRKRSNSSGATSMMARLTHARLYGSDIPYEDRSSEELFSEMRQLGEQYRDQDEYFLFEEQANDVQIVICNQGDEAIRDASLAVLIPNHEAVFVASHLPKSSRNGQLVDRDRAEQRDYPPVSVRNNAINVSVQLGDIPPGAPVAAFKVPLRLCVGDALAGKKLGVRYSLYAQNLRTPARGRLRLLLQRSSSATARRAGSL